MANSRVGQYRLEFTLSGFTSPARTHALGLWVAPTSTPSAGALPTAIDCQLKSGSTKTLQEVANQFCSFIRPLYATSIALEQFTLWHYVTANARDYISGGTAVPTTTGSGTPVEAQQATWSFRTANGGIAKFVMLELSATGSLKSAMSALSAGNSFGKFRDYILSADSPAIGLDNSYAVSGLFYALGQNEKVWRNIYRG